MAVLFLLLGVDPGVGNNARALQGLETVGVGEAV